MNKFIIRIAIKDLQSGEFVDGIYTGKATDINTLQNRLYKGLNKNNISEEITDQVFEDLIQDVHEHKNEDDGDNEMNNNRTLISKRQLLAETAKALGTRFTIDDVKTVYRALQDTAQAHLKNANEDNAVVINFGQGLSITSAIKQVNGESRMWLRAKISRHHNRTAVNEL